MFFANSLTRVGQAKLSGGALQWGIPTYTNFSSSGTSALNINECRYVPIRIDYPITLNAWELEVTSGPASAAHLEIGIYLADNQYQPVGGPLYDSGSIAVAQSFTGIKSVTGLTVTLGPGVYLVAINCDVAMTLRTFISGSWIIESILGSTPMIARVSVAQTFGVFPNPGAAWTALTSSASGLQHFAAWQWTN